MDTKKTEASARILMTITSPKAAGKVEKLLAAGHIAAKYRLNALGTASSEMISALGLGSPDKVVIISMMPRFLANKLLDKMKTELRLNTVNSGIAFTIPISGASSQFLKMISLLMPDSPLTQNEGGATHMEEMKYSLIAVIANRGYSEEIMAAARTAGARGGTVLNSRKIVDEDTAKFWEFSIQEEKETTIILSPNENKLDIMKAIGSKCGLHSDAKGVVLSIPVDSVMGME